MRGSAEGKKSQEGVSPSEIIRARRPKLAVLTHFGMTMLRAKPWELAASMEQELGVRVMAAYDHMRLDLQSLEKS